MADELTVVALGVIRERHERRTAPPFTSDANLKAAIESAGDVMPLLSAIDAVLELHQPEPGQHPDFCGADLREMPCPTVAAISSVLRRLSR